MSREDEQPPANGNEPPANDEAIARLEAEMAALRDRLLRALADQENLRRRAAREREDAVRFAASNVIKDLLPTADSIRRAIESVPGEHASGRRRETSSSRITLPKIRSLRLWPKPIEPARLRDAL